MTEQKKKIAASVNFITDRMPKDFKPRIALIKENNLNIKSLYRQSGLIYIKDINSEIEINVEEENRKLIFAKFCNKDIIIIDGRYHFYDGVTMRDIAHYIYVLKFLGVKKIISIDESGLLNPRFECGELSLIYDHINLMGDNPLIGENDETLGIRFPDMSNAYDRGLFEKVYSVFQDKKMKMNESVYVGILGPETETEAEARFYRDIGADILGYSLVPENITAVHAKLLFLGIGLLTRELIADKMMIDESTEEQKQILRKKHLRKCEKELIKILPEIIKIL